MTLRPKKMRATHLTTVANMFYGNTTAHDEERMLVMTNDCNKDTKDDNQNNSHLTQINFLVIWVESF